jgi:DNA-binding FadR family transcriptional regulator
LPRPIWSDQTGQTKPAKFGFLLTTKHEQVAAGLIKDILNGRYGVGERLPSERDLSARFDANRGSVREAMKKLEQLGLAVIQPGGARVKDKEEASLEVIGHLLAQGALPDGSLVDQILIVINSLISVAAEQVTELASDDEINSICDLARPLYERELDEEAHTLARFELMSAIMQTSKNLPLYLIARTLFQQVMPNMTGVHEWLTTDRQQYASLARQLHRSLQKRDVPAVRETFAAFSDLHRETMMHALSEARANLTTPSQEASS